MKRICMYFFLLTAVVITFSGCIRGKGEAVSKTFKVANFTGIKNNIGAEINLTRDSVQSVEIIAQPNITDLISLSVADDILNIRFAKKPVFSARPIKINISMSEFSSICINGSGDLKTTNTFDSCGTVAIEINGSGNVVASLHAREMINTSIRGSGSVNLSGSSPAQKISITGAGNIDAYSFRTAHSEVNISGSGSCNITADSTLRVMINGSGSVDYKGHPDLSTAVTGSGSVHEAN